MLCNKLKMYSTKCFILYTIKYNKWAANVWASQIMEEQIVPKNVEMFQNEFKAWE